MVREALKNTAHYLCVPILTGDLHHGDRDENVRLYTDEAVYPERNTALHD